MKTSACVLCALLVLLGHAASGVAPIQVGEGLQSAVNAYRLGELVKEAKRSDPNSSLPWMIEHMLAGISMATDPTVTMEAVFPGALAASAIGQLIDRHGQDIANMTYRERRVFIGNEYGDPSVIPTTYAGKPDAADEMCRAMFDEELSGVSDCRRYAARIREFNQKKKPSAMDIRHCNEDLALFYDHMASLGKNKLVKEAGAVGLEELKNLPVRPNAAKDAGVDRCRDLSGQWQQTFGKVTSTWTLTKRRDGSYDAVESGLGRERGVGTFDGADLKIEWGGKKNKNLIWEGVYTWPLNAACTGSEGEGTLHFTNSPEPGRGDEKSTVKRIR